MTTPLRKPLSAKAFNVKPSSAKKMSKGAKHDEAGHVAAELLDILALAKQGYKSADASLEYLISLCRIDNCAQCGAPRFRDGGIVKTKDGRQFRIVDKFAAKNITNVGQNVRRYEVEEISS